ncbi:hypothetical protein RHMOL_Rhmol04G0169800 [Rhododendron molle]|uniref:Uncharacterized protein n=1 Tax=Rhododendron molle TaxID=49168 RepID=A0ACC0P187_RHOML|nr:hypothetical protein RHMOL_Rhmol04G0169800 [Rhododendron molle]
MGGGLIHDSYGTRVIGFHPSLRPMHSLEAELWAVRDGLQLAINNQFAPICVVMDASFGSHPTHYGTDSTAAQPE